MNFSILPYLTMENSPETVHIFLVFSFIFCNSYENSSHFYFAFVFIIFSLLDMHIWDVEVLKDSFLKLLFFFILISLKFFIIFCKRARWSEFFSGLGLPWPSHFFVLYYMFKLFCFITFKSDNNVHLSYFVFVYFVCFFLYMTPVS